MKAKSDSQTYEQLRTALSQAGCPICLISRQAGSRYLDNLLYAFVNDPGIHESLLRPLGFCRRHSHALLLIPGQRLGVAIIQQALLKEARRRLGQKSARPQPALFHQLGRGRQPKDAPASPDPSAAPLDDRACPACQRERDTALRAVRELLIRLIDDLDQPLQEGGGLCWPHFQLALAQSPEPQVVDHLNRLQSGIWTDVIANLEEFIRKNDYRFQAEVITEAEKGALAQAINLLTGAPDA